jgi:hypothetical protein
MRDVPLLFYSARRLPGRAIPAQPRCGKPVSRRSTEHRRDPSLHSESQRKGQALKHWEEDARYAMRNFLKVNKRSAAAIVSAIIALTPRLAFAHGEVGDYTFIEPLIAIDPFPQLNEIDVARPQAIFGSQGRQVAVAATLEKQLSQNFGLEVDSGWIRQSFSSGVSRQGFDVLTLIPKYSILVVPEHAAILTIGAMMMFPVGSSAVQFHNYTELGPQLLWAKGFSDLPDLGPLKYLRPFGLEGDAGYAPAIAGPVYHWLFADLVVQYGLSYLSTRVLESPLPYPLRKLFVFSEFNYNQAVIGPPGQTFPLLYATPGVAYMGDTFQVSIAGQFSLNHAAAATVSNMASVPNSHGAVLFLVDIFFDQLFPAAAWTPF